MKKLIAVFALFSMMVLTSFTNPNEVGGKNQGLKVYDSNDVGGKNQGLKNNNLHINYNDIGGKNLGI